MSLSGIRDLSVMETPPEERLPITTYVGTYDDRLVREAILREQERNGQTFFVHNRIQSIYSVTSGLQNLVPEAKMSVAHGRMPDELDKVMTEFGSKKSDVLVTTTIIESGLDMPNVNTIIVDEADKVGLTQLYQLRGRVGRGGNNAHAYFLFKKGKQLTPQAKKRLNTISETTELGAGFAIAMKDLEIRGAGNLLGAEQSGYMASVGFDLYCRLLAEVVDELKQRQAGILSTEKPQIYNPAIDLPIVSNIPEDYISDMHIRINYYRQLASVKEAYEIENIANELKDRFGTLPQAVMNLLYVAMIKLMAIEAKTESVATKDKQIIVLFGRGKDLSALQLPDNLKIGVTIGVKQIKLDVERLGDRWQDVLKKILQVTTTDS
jgi:transcription-repair coupling factor (superfamily II helicase)